MGLHQLNQESWLQGVISPLSTAAVLVLADHASVDARENERKTNFFGKSSIALEENEKAENSLIKTISKSQPRLT